MFSSQDDDEDMDREDDEVGGLTSSPRSITNNPLSNGDQKRAESVPNPNLTPNTQYHHPLTQHNRLRSQSTSPNFSPPEFFPPLTSPPLGSPIGNLARQINEWNLHRQKRQKTSSPESMETDSYIGAMRRGLEARIHILRQIDKVLRPLAMELMSMGRNNPRNMQMVSELFFPIGNVLYTFDLGRYDEVTILLQNFPSIEDMLDKLNTLKRSVEYSIEMPYSLEDMFNEAYDVLNSFVYKSNTQKRRERTWFYNKVNIRL